MIICQEAVDKQLVILFKKKAHMLNISKVKHAEQYDIHNRYNNRIVKHAEQYNINTWYNDAKVKCA